MCEKEDNTPFEGCFPVLLIGDAGISFIFCKVTKAQILFLPVVPLFIFLSHCQMKLIMTPKPF